MKIMRINEYDPSASCCDDFPHDIDFNRDSACIPPHVILAKSNPNRVPKSWWAWWADNTPDYLGFQFMTWPDSVRSKDVL